MKIRENNPTLRYGMKIINSGLTQLVSHISFFIHLVWRGGIESAYPSLIGRSTRVYAMLTKIS